jgi:hypothetical protein
MEYPLAVVWSMERGRLIGYISIKTGSLTDSLISDFQNDEFLFHSLNNNGTSISYNSHIRS